MVEIANESSTRQNENIQVKFGFPCSSRSDILCAKVRIARSNPKGNPTT
jgi:hypothetical protein